MGNLTSKSVAAKSKGQPGRFADGGGLYFVVPKSGVPYWMLRYTLHSKRKEMTLGKLQDFSLAEARAEAAIKMKQVREGLDPLTVRKRAEMDSIKTVDDLFQDWHAGNLKRLKNPTPPFRIYTKEISPIIGSLPPSEVSARDIRHIINRITESNRPSIANIALMYCKQLLNHGVKLDIITGNPALAFNINDAGGVIKSKDRALSWDELDFIFKKFRENLSSFTRDNYLACTLLLLLGIRKSELTEMPWSELDLDNQVWRLPEERSKTGVGIDIPLSDLAVECFKELQIRSCGSEFVFPARGRSKRPYMSHTTLNRAIAKLFGSDPGKVNQPENQMGEIEYFTVHDLRRTCRSLLASLGIPGHIAERCLNHKLQGVEGVYNRYDYFEERKEALDLLAKKISPIAKIK